MTAETTTVELTGRELSIARWAIRRFMWNAIRMAEYYAQINGGNDAEKSVLFHKDADDAEELLKKFEAAP